MKQKNHPDQEKIIKLQEEIHLLKEYLLSDCCKQCAEIINKIEKYEAELKTLYQWQ
jgi:hypothetical protein